MPAAATATPFAMDALSQHLLERKELTLWRRVFLATGERRVEFDEGTLYLVCTDAPRHRWDPSELALFAQRFGGWHEPLGDDDALLAFPDAAGAMRAALLLQQIGADCSVRAAVTMAHCTVACIETDGETRRVAVLPPDACRPEESLRRVPPSTLVICADCYADLEPLLAEEARDVLVTTEFDPGELPEASITLLPHATCEMSTFAGLGSW
jgi:hypothetical protein